MTTIRPAPAPSGTRWSGGPVGRARELTGDLARRVRRADPVRRRPVTTTTVLIVLAVVVDAAMIWQRRWMSDDGLIFLRTVRQILAGNGPVFNVGERVETNTSTLWTLVLVALSVLPVRLEYASLVACGLASVGAFALALDGARRLAGPRRLVVPAGGLVVLALPPFWDFGTSGLETGLSFAWLAGTWWLLVRRAQRPPDGARPPAWPLALLVGLGPLVRPDLALAAAAFGVALAVLVWPRDRRGWLRVSGLGALAVAPAAAYEVFRAGYYGLLVPSTALAKEAGASQWGRGAAYLGDTVTPYWLWLPAIVLIVAVALTVPRGRTRDRARAGVVAVALAPVVGGIGLALYVVRVGGDFMHARMLLPAFFCLLLPVMALPLRRRLVLPVLVLVVWALVVGVQGRPLYHGINPTGIADERDFYRQLLGDDHPLTADDYRAHPYVDGGVALVTASPRPVLAVLGSGQGPAGPEWDLVPLAPGQPSGLVFLNLGATGAIAPLDVAVRDTVGLASPLAAHSVGVPDGRIGHGKNLPTAWLVAASGGTPTDDRAVSPDDVAAASRALRCPAIAELRASVSAPLTWSRFWENLAGAPARTALRFPRDPVLAEVACEESAP